MATRKSGALSDIYADIRRDAFKPVYLLYGEEDFQIERAAEALRAALLKGIPVDFNFDSYHARDADIDAVIASARMVPMMAPRRLVILKEVFEFKDKAVDRLVSYIKSPSPTTVLVMIGGSPGRKRKLVDAVRKVGRAFQARPLYESGVRKWIQEESLQMGKRLRSDAVHALMELVGFNLRTLHGEMTKLATYVGDRQDIRLDDIRAVISDVHIDTVYAFNDAVGMGQADRAMLQLTRLLELSTSASATSIIISLHYHLRKLYRARRLLDMGEQPKDIARAIHIQPNMVWKFERDTLPQVRRRSAREILTMIARTYDALYQTRTLRVPEGYILDKMILDFCRSPQTAGGRR